MYYLIIIIGMYKLVMQLLVYFSNNINIMYTTYISYVLFIHDCYL
jgi:hypothetical protein